jgi:hypothetical protein
MILPWRVSSATILISSLIFLSQCSTSALQHHPFQRLLEVPQLLLVQDSDMEILRDICSWYFGKTRFIVVIPLDSEIASDFTVELLPIIHSKVNATTIVSHIAVPEDVSTSPGRLWKNLRTLHQSFVIIVEREEAMIQFLRFIQESSMHPLLRNPRGHFLIIFLETSENDQSGVKGRNTEKRYSLLLQELWKELGILNIIPIVIKYSDRQSKSGRIVFVATFNPFINTTSRNLVVINGNYVINLSRSYTDRLNNLRGYPLRITLFSRKPTSFPLNPGDKVIDYIGVDGFFMRNLAKRMNFTAIASGPKDGYEYGFMFENNGTFTGSLGDILYDRADISLNSRFVKTYGTDDIEFTSSVGFDNLCIIVPKAKLLPKWLAFFRVFHLHVHFALFFVYVGCSLFDHILQRIYSLFKPVDKDISLITTFMEMLPPFLSLSLVRMPSFRAEKVFVTSCFIFGIIIASSFQGKLVTVLSKPDYYRDINTLEELDASGLFIGTGSVNLVENTFSTEDSPLVNHLRNKIIYRLLENGIIDYVAKHQNIAALNRLSNALYSVLLYRNSDGTFLLHIVEECPRTYSLAYIVPKGSPFLFRTNHIITQLVESGIVNKWNENTYFNMTAFHRCEYSGNTSLKVFSLEDLQMAFLMLACGLSCSTIAFFVELTMNRLASHKGA